MCLRGARIRMDATELGQSLAQIDADRQDSVIVGSLNFGDDQTKY